MNEIERLSMKLDGEFDNLEGLHLEQHFPEHGEGVMSIAVSHFEEDDPDYSINFISLSRTQALKVWHFINAITAESETT